MHRVYCALRLNLPRRTVRRVPKRVRQPLEAPRTLNQTWAMDVMSDMLYDGRRVRALTIIDEGNREALDILVAASLPSVRASRVLDALIHGAPQAVHVYNGPEFLAQSFVDWCAAHGSLRPPVPQVARVDPERSTPEKPGPAVLGWCRSWLFTAGHIVSPRDPLAMAAIGGSSSRSPRMCTRCSSCFDRHPGRWCTDSEPSAQAAVGPLARTWNVCADSSAKADSALGAWVGSRSLPPASVHADACANTTQPAR